MDEKETNEVQNSAEVEEMSSKETVEEVKAEETTVEETTSDAQDTIEETVEEAVDAEEEVKVKKLPADKKGTRGKRKVKIETKEAPVSEWKERVVQVRRVTKVVKGGKKLSFRAIVVVGNQKGQVGVGCAKAAEVISAIQKAIADGRKNVISVPIFKKTIPHPIVGRSGAGEVVLKPASEGTGVIAGGSVRAVLELAGIENILSKSLGSKAPLNAAGATINALKSLRTFSDVAKVRGITIKDMLN